MDTAPVALPVVAVVDTALVQRRRRIARPVQRIAAIVFGASAGVLIGVRPSGVLVAVLLGLCAVALVVFAWSLPWAAIRPPSAWYLGVEAEGLRLPTPVVPAGQLFLPWWAVGRVGVRRYALAFPVLRIRLRPEAGALLAGADPLAVAKVLRHGFSVGLQGTSMTAADAARVIAAVRR